MSERTSSSPRTRFEVRHGAATHPGLVRDHNEDSLLASRNTYLVADGLGGHAKGEVASQAVVAAFQAESHTDWLTPDGLNRALEQASRVIAQASGDAGRAPGSTVVGVGLAAQSGLPYWMIFNVGDSRAYMLRSGKLQQISVDHSRVQAVLDAGGQVSSAARNVITRAIGAGLPSPVLADQWLMPAAVGDRVMLCSDGLSTEVSDQLIAATLLAFSEPQEAADELVRAALNAGGRDNVTVVVVDAIAVVGNSDTLSVSEDTLGGLPLGVEEPSTLPDGEALWPSDGDRVKGI